MLVNCQLHSPAALLVGMELPVYQYYIHKVPVILHDNLQPDSHKPYGSSTPVTWLQLLRKQTNTGTFTAPTAGSPLSTHTTSYTLPTCDISLGSLMLPALEAGDFAELFLLYIS